MTKHKIIKYKKSHHKSPVRFIQTGNKYSIDNCDQSSRCNHNSSEECHSCSNINSQILPYQPNVQCEPSCDSSSSDSCEESRECKKIIAKSASINCLQVNKKFFYDGHFIEVDDIIPPQYITSVVIGNTMNPPIQPALILPTAIPIPQGVFVPVSLPIITPLPNFVSIISTEIPETIRNNFRIKTITSKIFIQNTSTANVDVVFGLYLYTRSVCGELLEPLDLSIATVLPSQVQSFDVAWDQSKSITFPAISQYPSDILVFAIFTTVMLVGVQSSLSNLQTYNFPYDSINFNIKLTR